MPLLAALVVALHVTPPPALPAALPNDNRTAAGVTVAGARRIRFVVQRAVWHPDADDGPSLVTEAIGEEGKAPLMPGPLIRVRRGTSVDATVRNTLRDTLVVWVQQPANATDSTLIAPGETRALRVRTDRTGTFTYGTMLSRGGRLVTNVALPMADGAIVVDSTDAPPPDRVLVLQAWTQRWDTTKAGDDERLVMTINGKMWPHTERFRFTVGDTVRWRVVNTTGDTHPMHLHGFYFRVDSRGDGGADTVYSAEQRRWVVTEELVPDGTFTLTWVPQRAGNWIFHCHKSVHVSGFMHTDLAGERHDYGLPSPHDAHASDAEHVLTGMGGLVIGIQVEPRGGAIALASSARAPATKHLRLYAQNQPTGPVGKYGYVLQQGDAVPARDSVQVPGPPLVLTRGEPVEITVVNRSDMATGVHWHGIELDSYYDGIGGWSGAGARLAPRVAPNDSFLVRFTPPRAGTFMYHAHSDEVRQIGLGMYGPIVVLEPGKTWDPTADHVLMIGDAWSNGNPYLGVNGAPAGYTMRLAVDKTHRLRLLNILVDTHAQVALLDSAFAPIVWRPVAKDGADLPPTQRVQRPATLEFGPGEAVDVEISPPRGRYYLRVIGTGYSNALVTIVVR